MLPGLIQFRRVPARLVARRHPRWSHRGRLSGAAGHGVRRGRGPAAGGRALGHHRPTRGLRGARLVQATFDRAGVDNRADDGGRADADRGRRPGAVRNAGGHSGPAGRRDLPAGPAGPTGIPGGPAVQACPGRLHGGGFGDHDRRAAGQGHGRARSRGTSLFRNSARSSGGWISCTGRRRSWASSWWCCCSR